MLKQNTKENKVRILHLVKDDKFCDGTIKAFDTDRRLINRGALVVNNPNYHFTYIQQHDRIDILWNKKMVKQCLQSQDYDVLFIHALTPSVINVFRFIPHNKIVIWWSWGYDLYGGFMGMDAIVHLNKYKPKTLLLNPEAGVTFKDKLRCVQYGLINFINKKRLNKIIPRIDYFCPVLHSEYKRMRTVPGFKAKEFYIPNSFPYCISDIIPLSNKGAILLGNSATYTNNHLDVWADIKSYIPTGRTIIVPISYGNKQYAKILKKEIKSDKHDIQFLESLIPRSEYFNLLKSCSFAVFGVIRQQAMGNVYQCVQNGTKVFLYKESIVYEDLKNEGFVVYAIEDMDASSVNKPLTEEEIIKQAEALSNQCQYQESVCNKAIEEIIESIKHKNE